MNYIETLIVRLNGPVVLSSEKRASTLKDDLDILIDNAQQYESARVLLLKAGYKEIKSGKFWIRSFARLIEESGVIHRLDLHLEPRYSYKYCFQSYPIEAFDRESYSLGKYLINGASCETILERISQETLDKYRITPSVLTDANRFRLIRRLKSCGMIVTNYSPITKVLVDSSSQLFTYLFKRKGLEIALVGVDGSGKSTLTKSLEGTSLGPRIKRIYMGNNEPSLIPRLIFLLKNRYLDRMGWHVEMLLRRIRGLQYAHRGYIVLYDRHPIENVMLSGGMRFINNSIAKLYVMGLDMSILLTGDPQQFFRRKKEHNIELLVQLRDELDQKLELSTDKLRISVDTVKSTLEATVKELEDQITHLIFKKLT